VSTLRLKDKGGGGGGGGGEGRGEVTMLQASQGSPAGPPGRSGIKMKICEEEV
jgi:hypothetical protein